MRFEPLPFSLYVGPERAKRLQRRIRKTEKALPSTVQTASRASTIHPDVDKTRLKVNRVMVAMIGAGSVK
jgi:hypothetical protein